MGIIANTVNAFKRTISLCKTALAAIPKAAQPHRTKNDKDSIIRALGAVPLIVATITALLGLRLGKAEIGATRASSIAESIITPNHNARKQGDDFYVDMVDDIGDYYDKSNTSREALFAIRHPIIASEIGRVIQGRGVRNISTNATRFSNGLNLNENDAREGSQVNAVRHALWIATITQRYGENIALQAGNAHEENPAALNAIEDAYSHEFGSLNEADEAIDLLNNIIGREIGKSSNSPSMKDITKNVLDYYHETGLNVAVADEENGIFTIVVERLSDEQYNEAIDILETLDNCGFSPDSEYYNYANILNNIDKKWTSL